MLIQFAFGTLMIVITVVIATGLMSLAFEAFHIAKKRLFGAHPFARTTATLSMVTLSIVVALTVVMWIWAAAVLALGIVPDWEAAIYVTMVAFTTLGGGDPLLPDRWRLLSGFIGTGGFILFGLATAFMFEAIADLRRAHRERRNPGSQDHH
ncbi:MAG: ion channel [Pseudomonadota bacterium]